MEELRVTIPAFGAGGWIPKEYTGRGADRSPEIRLEGVSPGGVSLAVTLDDASHPLFPNYNHWLLWNLPPADHIPPAIPAGPVLERLGGARQGVAYGRHRYRGPKPPFRAVHTYVFTVYVLDTMLELPPRARRRDFLKACGGHILQKAACSGRFQSPGWNE